MRVCVYERVIREDWIEVPSFDKKTLVVQGEDVLQEAKHSEECMLSKPCSDEGDRAYQAQASNLRGPAPNPRHFDPIRASVYPIPHSLSCYVRVGPSACAAALVDMPMSSAPRPTDVDREVVIFFMVTDEIKSSNFMVRCIPD